MLDEQDIASFESSDFEFELETVLFPSLCEAECPINEPHVIIYADSFTDRVFAMNLRRALKPIAFSYQELLRLLQERTVIKGSMEIPNYMLVSENQLSERDKKARDSKILIIQPILVNLESFLVGDYGKNLVRQIERSSSSTIKRAQVYKLIYRYFQSGCRANAFLRKPGSGFGDDKNYSKKTGPERTVKPGKGKMLSKADKKNIEKTINSWVNKTQPMAISKAYRVCLDSYYSEPIFKGKEIEYLTWDVNEIPSEIQFRRHANKYINKKPAKTRKAQGLEAEFAKNHAGSKGTISDIFDRGPGYCYQIDETPFDLELVSQLDPTRKERVGKATLYVARDMSTKAFVGLYITFKAPSAQTASNILYNIFSNKKKYYQQLGIEIGEKDWPMEGKPTNIMVDNGEFKAELIRSVAKDANVRVLFNKEGHSHDKGLSEHSFKMLHEWIAGAVRGYSPNNLPPHIKRNRRKEALLNINELYQIMIKNIIIFNQCKVVESICLSKELRQAGVKRIPQIAWDYGRKYRAGYLRTVNEDELSLELLEVGKVTVHKSHIFLQKYQLKYKCDWLRENGYQDTKKAGNSSPQFECRIMQHSLGTIFIAIPGEGLKPATLQKVDGQFAHLSNEEVLIEKEFQAKEENMQNEIYQQKHSSVRMLMDNLQKNALKEQQPINANQANTQDLSENRKILNEIENQKDKARFDAAVKSEFGISNDSLPSNVIPPQHNNEIHNGSDEAQNHADMVRRKRQKKQLK